MPRRALRSPTLEVSHIRRHVRLLGRLDERARIALAHLGASRVNSPQPVHPQITVAARPRRVLVFRH